MTPPLAKDLVLVSYACQEWLVCVLSIYVWGKILIDCFLWVSADQDTEDTGIVGGG
jgi:hypothetical protein